MKKTVFLALAFGVLTACSSTEEQLGTDTELKAIHVDVERLIYQDSQTRTVLSSLSDGSQLQVSWSKEDVIGIFPATGDQVSFPMLQGEGKANATFTGGGWALKADATYSAYYPFSTDNFFRTSKNVKVVMADQTQNGNASTAHLGAYDILATDPCQATEGAVTFLFKHQACLVSLNLTLPAATPLASVTLRSDRSVFMTSAAMDITTAPATFIPVESSNTISLQLENATTAADNKFQAYMFVLPVDLSDQNLAVTATDTNGKSYQQILTAGANFERGKILVLNCTLTEL